MGFLHRVFRQCLAAEARIGDLLQEAVRLSEASPGQYEVLVPFLTVPEQQTLAESLPEWRSGPQVREWLATHASGEGVRQNGAFVYSIRARAPFRSRWLLERKRASLAGAQDAPLVTDLLERHARTQMLHPAA